MVIILFNMSLYMSTFSTNSFGKLVFCLSELFVLCRIEFDVTFTKFVTFSLHNHGLYKYQVLCGLFSLTSKKRYRVINI